MSRPTRKIGGPGSPRPTYKNSRQKQRQALRRNYELVVPPGTEIREINDLLEDLGLTLGQVWLDDCLTNTGIGAKITIPEAHRSSLAQEQVGEGNDGG